MRAKHTEDLDAYWDAQAILHRGAAAIDPADTLGRKTAYIAHCRNLALASGLDQMAEGARVLDFGCGTGTFLTWLEQQRPDCSGYGIDLSSEMLHVALELHPNLAGHIATCDGRRLPMRGQSIDVICTAITLIYLTDDDALLALAKEFRRALVPGGLVVSVEQVRRHTHRQIGYRKIQRAPEDYLRIFSEAGFTLQGWRQIRRGRFPLTYLIRYGLIPRAWMHPVANLESWLWRDSRLPSWDYADALFIWRAPG